MNKHIRASSQLQVKKALLEKFFCASEKFLLCITFALETFYKLKRTRLARKKNIDFAITQGLML